MRFYQPDVWGTKTVELTNWSSEPANIVTGGYCEGAPLNRFARRVTVPPESTRLVSFLILPTGTAGKTMQWRPLLYRADDDRALLRASDDSVIDSEPLSQPPASVTAVIADRYTTDDEKLDSLMELAAVSQITLGLTRRIVELDVEDVPVEPGGLDVIDRIVLGSNCIADDPARLQCLRSWVEQGGRLWIRLDYVEATTVHRLMGDSVSVEVVDRAGLTSFQIENQINGNLIPESLSFDYPVDCVRVLAEGVTIVHQVNGWPASFATSIGSGTVVFTTMGNRAWLRDRTNEDPPAEAEYRSNFIARPALVEVVDKWMVHSDASPLDAGTFEPALTTHVGYEIPRRVTILSALGLFCATLIGSGWWLNRTRQQDDKQNPQEGTVLAGRRLELMAVLSPVLALVAAVPIMVLGQTSRNAIPAGVTSYELVRVSPATSTLQSSGTAAVFAPDSKTADFSTSDGRVLLPSRERLAGTLQQMTQSDFGEYNWSGLNVNSGLQFFQSRQTRPLAQPVSATVTFGPDGAQGVLQAGSFSDPQDAIIAGQSPDVLALTIDSNQHFRGGPESTLAPGVYVSGTLLTDKQVQRQQIYESLLGAKKQSRYPRHPTLLTWMQPQESGVNWPQGFATHQRSLVAIPIEYARTAPDTNVVIPSPFLPGRSVTTDDGNRSSAYDNRNGMWQESLQPGRVLMQFEIPNGVRPLKLNSVNLELKLLAPARSVDISVGSRHELAHAALIEDGAGMYSYELTDANQLRLGPDGYYYVMVNVLAPADGTTGALSNKLWNVDFLRIEMSGRTIKPTAIQTSGQETTEE